MSTAQKITEVQHEANSALGRRLTFVATGLAGAAAFGLIGAMATPTIPIVSILAAFVGLAGGLFSTKFDKK